MDLPFGLSIKQNGASEFGRCPTKIERPQTSELWTVNKTLKNAIGNSMGFGLNIVKTSLREAVAVA